MECKAVGGKGRDKRCAHHDPGGRTADETREPAGAVGGSHPHSFGIFVCLMSDIYYLPLVVLYVQIKKSFIFIDYFSTDVSFNFPYR